MKEFTMAKIPQQNYTQIPNVILDNLPKLKDCELRVLLCVCRETFGWHEKKALLSISFIAKATGYSEQAVVNGTAKLLKRQLIQRSRRGQSFAYSLVISKPGQYNDVINSDPKPLNDVYRQPLNDVETSKEREVNKEEGASAPPLSSKEQPVETNSMRQFTDGWCNRFKERFGHAYAFKRPDGIAAAQLLKSFPAEDLLKTAVAAWAKTDPSKYWCCVNQSISLCKFASKINEIHAELDRNAPLRAGYRNSQGRVINAI